MLVTGANGFVGRALCAALRNMGYTVRAAVRDPVKSMLAGCEVVSVPWIGAATDWTLELAGCVSVIHLAARAHIMCDDAAHPLAAYREVNTAGTLNLARQAAAAGVRRFLFVSSVKVNGEFTLQDQAFRASDTPQTEDPYGISKQEAEQGLRAIAAETGMEVVIIRPPVVYGLGVKGNFASMLHWLRCGIPLPLGAILHNRRSLVALDNLVDLIVTCVDHPAATSQTFLVSDGEDLSTADLLRRLGMAMGKPARLVPVPPALLQASAKLLGKGDVAQRLLGNLQVDISHTCQTLGWKPPVSVDDGLRQAVQRGAR